VTQDKVQKQAVRVRMAKTGEHYTTARHFLLDLHRHDQSDTDSAHSGADEAAPEFEPEPLAAGAASSVTEAMPPDSAVDERATPPPA